MDPHVILGGFSTGPDFRYVMRVTCFLKTIWQMLRVHVVSCASVVVFFGHWATQCRSAFEAPMDPHVILRGFSTGPDFRWVAFNFVSSSLMCAQAGAAETLCGRMFVRALCCLGHWATQCRSAFNEAPMDPHVILGGFSTGPDFRYVLRVLVHTQLTQQ
jgi:hypothetical protein